MRGEWHTHARTHTRQASPHARGHTHEHAHTRAHIHAHTRARTHDTSHAHSLQEQLDLNWDPLGGYRAGTNQYANVWTRDAFFALLAPIPQRGVRLAHLVNRLESEMLPSGQLPYQFHQVRVNATACDSPVVPTGERKRRVHPHQCQQVRYVMALLLPSFLPDSWKRRARPIACYEDEKLERTVCVCVCVCV